METSLRDMLSRTETTASAAEVRASVSRFVDRYLHYGDIDSRWRPVLQSLSRHPGIPVIIATDHYAEATDTIMGFLEAMNIRCARVSEVPCSGEVSSVIVANSADLGYHKACARFWGMLKAKMGITDLTGILLVDDFGYNEETSARYSDRHKVETREKETVNVLREVFQTDIHVVPFMLESIRDHGLNGLTGDLHERYGRLIEKTRQAIEDFFLVAGGQMIVS